MDSEKRSTIDLAALEPTIDRTPLSPSSVGSSRAPRVAVVQGATPRLAHEVHALLAARLRAAALLMGFGFLAFLVWRTIDQTSFLRVPSQRSNQLIHAAITIGLLAGGTLLCVRCPQSLKRLRFYEFLIFAGPAAFFIDLQCRQVEMACGAGNLPQLFWVMRGTPLYWLLLILNYAALIPNTWRRAAINVGGIAIAPIGIALWAFLSCPFVAENYPKANLIELSLVMGIGWAVAVYGAHSIGALRREAFEARQLGQYRLKELIGAGGMGEVYLAEHQLLKRPCAIKLIRPSEAANPRALARFEREVRATATLSHWNSVEIFDYGHTQDGTFYYVMEYLPGLSLGALVDRFGPLPAGRVIYLMRQTCDGLREAHAQGMVHRDIKPGNIFAALRGGIYDVAKLLDFGLVKPTIASADDELTVDGAITGSPLYMSPEQSLGEQSPDQRSDIYSLGAVMYFLLTGAPPFVRDTPLKIMFAHAHDEPAPPSTLHADVPHDLEEVVLRCLAKSPGARYSTALELREALDACEAAGSWSESEARAWWHSSADRARPLADSLA